MVYRIESEAMKLLYLSPRQHGKAMQQAKELAERAKGFNNQVTIEVVSEETFKLREENKELKRIIRRLKAE